MLHRTGWVFLGWLLILGAALAQPQAKPEKLPAKIKVLALEGTVLEIDGKKTDSTGPERLFESPPIEPGKKYTYTIRIRLPRDMGFSERMALVHVEAGKETTVDLRPGKDNLSSRIIFVPTPEEIVEEMLRLAETKAGDLVYDLGCGDGRILTIAAKKYGTNGIGVDIDPKRVEEAKERVKKEGFEKKIEIRHGDALEVKDLDKASVVTLYMLGEFNTKVAPILEHQLKPGTRIVALDFPLPWKEVESKSLEGIHTLYLYKVEKKK